MIPYNVKKIKYVISGALLFALSVTVFVLFSNKVSNDDYIYLFILNAVLILSVWSGLTVGLIYALVGVLIYGAYYFFQTFVLEIRFGFSAKDGIWMILIPASALAGGYLGDGVVFIDKLFKKYLRQIESLLQTGQMGMVGNEITFQQDLKVEVSRSKRSLANFSLVLLQVGNIDSLQRLMGIDAADEASKKLSEAICRSTRDIDKKAKLGVTLYALILPDTGASETDVVLDRIRKNLIKVKMAYRGRQLKADIDLISGIAIYPEHAKDADILLQTSMKDLETVGKKNKNFKIDTEELKKSVSELKAGSKLGIEK